MTNYIELGISILIVVFIILKVKKDGEKKVSFKKATNYQQAKENYELLKKQEEEKEQRIEEIKKLTAQLEENKKLSYKEKIKKGIEYERQIAEIFKYRGYEVIEHGRLKGKKDGGIDLIAKRENKTVLIQCKNWNKTKIKHSHIKEFLYNAKKYIEENSIFEEVEFLFIASNDLFDKSAKGFIYHTNENVNFEVIPYIE